ncbi:MAG: nitroreductase family protein [Bacteroidota bacterium]
MASIKDIPEKKGPNPQYPVIDEISKRWSPRAFDPKDISDDNLYQLFEAMRWAPSSMNAQPWRILFARRGDEAFNKLHEALSPNNKSWTEDAPILMLAMVKKHLSDGSINGSAKHDLGLAMGNLLAQATSMGIGVHQMGGFSKEKVIDLLEIPDEFIPNTMVAIGYYGNPDQLPDKLKTRELNPRTRMEISDFVFQNSLK